MYGTWNSENAVAVSTNAMSTHAPEGSSPRPCGTAKVSAKNTGRAIEPTIMSGRREPRRARLRSLAVPITGSMSTSHTFASVTTMPAASAVMPNESVRKYTSTRPGRVPKPPVPSEPMA
jgi:hypothetical protein